MSKPANKHDTPTTQIGYTIASGALSRELNGPEIMAVPLVCDDTIRVGLIRRKDIPLSRPGTAYAEAIRAHVKK